MKKNDFTFRQFQKGDSLADIAQYVHLTDPYIYPCICEDPRDPFFCRLISDCAKEKTNLFCEDHFSLALCDEKIIGILCAVKCGEKLTFLENLNLSEAEHQKLRAANNGYFRPLLEETKAYSGYNITNVCVDTEFRGQGVGEKLLRFFLSRVGSNTVHLDVIANNISAVKLYERCGFKIEKGYHGFSNKTEPLLCYHMLRQ